MKIYFGKKVGKRIIFLTILGAFLIYGSKGMLIDLYNFDQLSKVKKVFELNKEVDYKIKNLVEFNEKYNQNIKPQKECHYISTSNGKHPYIYGFKLHSLIYKFIYGSNEYVYPEYDIPVNTICIGYCYDRAREYFEDTINQPCLGNISGYVYEDENGNGILDQGDKVVEGVGVTSGRGHVFTDSTGFYSIDIKDKEEGYIVKTSYYPEGMSMRTHSKYEKVFVQQGEQIRDINFVISLTDRNEIEEAVEVIK